jgi:hypothetical protein
MTSHRKHRSKKLPLISIAFLLLLAVCSISFGQGQLLPVVVDCRDGFINISGEVVVPHWFIEQHSFSE